MERDCFFGVNYKVEKTCRNCIYSCYDFDRHCYVCRMLDGSKVDRQSEQDEMRQKMFDKSKNV